MIFQFFPDGKQKQFLLCLSCRKYGTEIHRDIYIYTEIQCTEANWQSKATTWTDTWYLIIMTRTVDAGTFQILALLKWTEICFEKEPNINYQNSKKKSISWETNFFIYIWKEKWNCIWKTFLLKTVAVCTLKHPGGLKMISVYKYSGLPEYFFSENTFFFFFFFPLQFLWPLENSHYL